MKREVIGLVYIAALQMLTLGARQESCRVFLSPAYPLPSLALLPGDLAWPADLPPDLPLKLVPGSSYQG